MTKVLKTTVASQHDRFETPREPVRQITIEVKIKLGKNSQSKEVFETMT